MESRYYDPEIEIASRDMLRRLQEKKLKSIVQHAWEKSPFYRRKLEEANLSPEYIRSVEDIGRLPFFTKEDLRKTQEVNPGRGRPRPAVSEGAEISIPEIERLIQGKPREDLRGR